MENYGGYGGYGSDPVPDMVKQFVVYFYRHIRWRPVEGYASSYAGWIAMHV